MSKRKGNRKCYRKYLPEVADGKEAGQKGKAINRQTGAPRLLKTRRRMKRDAARKMWLKLLEQGWRQVKPQRGDGVDI